MQAGESSSQTKRRNSRCPKHRRSTQASPASRGSENSRPPAPRLSPLVLPPLFFRSDLIWISPPPLCSKARTTLANTWRHPSFLLSSSRLFPHTLLSSHVPLHRLPGVQRCRLVPLHCAPLQPTALAWRVAASQGGPAARGEWSGAERSMRKKRRGARQGRLWSWGRLGRGCRQGLVGATRILIAPFPASQVPWWTLVSFGSYLLWQVGWALFNFNDVPEAYESLMVVSIRSREGLRGAERRGEVTTRAAM